MLRRYFDHNATTPVEPRVLEAMLPCLKELYGNASSIHAFGQEAGKLVENARRQVGELLGCRPRDVVFTSGGTEADNLAILGAVRATRAEKKHVITTEIEHPAALAACRQLEREGVAVTFLPVGADGVVSPDDVRAALRPETVLITVMHANNEVGTVQPIAEISRIAREAEVPLHTDGVQSCGKLPTRVDELGVDYLSLSGHKIYGPKGVGALFVRRGAPLKAIQYGGRHERERRPGTLNVPGIVGLGAAAEIGEREGEAEARRLSELRDRLEEGLLERVPHSWINCRQSERTPNTSSIGFDFVEGESLLIAFDLGGFAVSSGAACSSGAVEPSHVLTAIGLSKDKAKSCLRFSLGRSTTAEDIDALLEEAPRIIERLRLLSPVAR